MALHTVRTTEGAVFDDVYSTRLSEAPLPKSRLPDLPSEPAAVHALIRDELAIDGNSSQNTGRRSGVTGRAGTPRRRRPPRT